MKYDTILLDIETQADFFQPKGSLYDRRSAPMASKAINTLFKWVKEKRIPVLSTVLRVRPGETGPLAETPHCIEGTAGERKLPRTILPDRLNLGMRNTTDLPDDIFQNVQQVIVEKRRTDIFKHERLERLITELPPVTFVVCGAGTAGGVVEAVVGLRSRGFPVIVAEDGILDLGRPLAEMSRLRMEAKNSVFAPAAEIVRPKPGKKRYRSVDEILESWRETAAR